MKKQPMSMSPCRETSLSKRPFRPGVLLIASMGAALVSGAGVSGPPAAGIEIDLRKERYPMTLFIVHRDETVVRAAAGRADGATQRELTVDTPVRMASVTKSFTAATVLRLWEQGKVDLDAPISKLLSPHLDRLLRDGGYPTARMTVRHLLSHSSGLYDHGGDPRFIETVLADPEHRWTREELVALSLSYAGPQSEPGTEFRYSDTGYILLGDIIEQVTGMNLGAAVRSHLRLDEIGLRATWWERFETPPVDAPPRARQWIGSTDATHLDPSMDLYGGGGLIMSARDLAIFAKALFEGRIFDRSGTLNEMLWRGPHEGGDQYRLGLFVTRQGRCRLYGHSGFWGTAYAYSPETGIAAAGVTTNRDAGKALKSLVEAAAAGRYQEGTREVCSSY